MDLKTYLFSLSVEDRDVFARKCGTSRRHLQHIAYGYRTAPPELAVAIERESKGSVPADVTLIAKWTRVRDASWPHKAGRPCFDPAKRERAAA